MPRNDRHGGLRARGPVTPRPPVARLLALALLTLSGAGSIDAAALDWARFAARIGQWEPAHRFPHMDCFEQAAERHRVPLTLLLAVARGESDFDPRARSKAEALGVMQILWPTTARHLGIRSRTALFEPCTNIDAGARYLAELLDRYPGDLQRAVAAYNYGPGRIRSDAPLPAGARWYADYILRHLRYVVSAQAGPADYAQERRYPVVLFTRPYHAEAFADSLRARDARLRLAVFRTAKGDFQVVLLAASEAELRRARRILNRLGFQLEAS